MINTVEVSVDAGADRAAVGADIQQALGDGFKLNEANDTTGTPRSLANRLCRSSTCSACWRLFLGAFLIFNTFRTVVIERRHDIAMLRAVGATRRQITHDDRDRKFGAGRRSAR